MANNVDWLTITPDNPVYTEVDTDIEIKYSQNTTPSTRLAELNFYNEEAETKHQYNPDTPTGDINLYVYQFGKRSANLTMVGAQVCPPAPVTCSIPTTIFSNSNIAPGDLPPYDDSNSYSIDFTLTNPSNPVVNGAATEYQQNAEQKFRNYFVSNDLAVPYTLTLTVESTSPWYIGGGDFWTGVDSQYFRALGSDDWAALRTYDSDDNVQTVSVDIDISANNTTSVRSTTLYVVTRQGIQRAITLNQAAYVLPNQPPIPVISPSSADTCGSSHSGFWNGSGSSDPDGVIVSYVWSATNGSPSSGTGTGFSTTISGLPANSSCTSNASSSGPRLTVTDDRNASNSTTATIVIGSRLACESSCSVSVSCSSPGGFNGTSSCTASVSSAQVPGCPTPQANITSSSGFNSFSGNGSPSGSGTVNNSGLTCPGDSKSVSVSAGHAYTNCGGSTSIQFGTKPAAPSFGITDQTITNSGGSQSFNVSCGASSPAGISSQNISCSGGGVNVNSNSGSASFTLSASQGNSSSATCSCSATDNATPAGCRQTNTASATFTYSNPSAGWNCNGDGTCSLVPGGMFPSQGACETQANCPPPVANAVVNMGCSPSGIQYAASDVPAGGATGQFTWNAGACAGDPGQIPRSGASPVFTLPAGNSNGSVATNSPFQNPCAVCGQYSGFRPGEPSVATGVSGFSSFNMVWTGPFST